MISAWHLLWILPITAMFGYFIAILMVAAKKADEEPEELTYVKFK